MAAQVSKKICSSMIIVILITMMFSISAQVSHSNACVKDCVVNQCMKASKKTTPAICDNPCKMLCDPINGGQYIVSPGESPIKRFCRQFSWICT
ncbi:PREDICTED: uncharacterized protein LOC104776304 [Camelina sativa]|uniref:Uncharacterized protein LOC104776304 n=1 Tax=Camelina sativa TaxID=90675 RepID=A0ABM0YBS2_CAMSA|nr:PREDICTED: uncharacterized protein LOC104776304 [Camelina sativa]